MTIVCCCWQHYNVILSNFYFVISCIYRICMKSGGQALYIGVICLHIELCGIFRNFYPPTQAWIRDVWTIIRLQWVHVCLCHFPSYWGFSDSSVGKESACSAGDPCSIPGSGRSTGKGKGYPLQYSGLENSMDWIVHGVAKRWTRLSNFHFLSLSSCVTEALTSKPVSPSFSKLCLAHMIISYSHHYIHHWNLISLCWEIHF